MQPLKVLIVDDEPLAQEILQTYISKIESLELVGVCKNAFEAFATLNKQSVDLVLLDINMPEMSGIDFLKSLKTPPLVIFTTAYSEFAIESYVLNAVDYLLKPISFPRFLSAIQKAAAAEKSPELINPIVQKQLFVRSNGKWIKIDVDKLWLIEGLKDYVILWVSNERFIIHSTMKGIEEQLLPYSNFIRIHKSSIINIDHISEIEGNSIKINNQLVAIGATYKDAVYKHLVFHKNLLQ